ncbi:MAG TPA: CorA family divalent cation transporter, partial [Microlunatus sp.]|nr:CorA family divalent cation transporter [Microlunatus sp.]
MTTGSGGRAGASKPARRAARLARPSGDRDGRHRAVLPGDGHAAQPSVDASPAFPEQLAGPVPISRVWSGAKVLAEDLAGEDLGDVLDLHDDAQCWWVLDRSSEYAHDALQRLVTEFDLDRLVVHEIMASDHRAKYEEVGQARLVLTNAVTLNHTTAEVSVHPISVLLTNRAIICLTDVTPDVDPRRWLAGAGERLATGGTEAALQVVMMGVIETYETVINWLEQGGDDLADELFTGKPLSKEQQLWSFRLRTGLSDLRRITEPMRSVMTDLRAGYPVVRPKGQPRVGAPVARRWSLIAEHHDRVANAADSLRESLTAVFETSLALADVQLNVIMKKLTGWAGIIAVPTLITGFVGMNVGFPLSGTSYGFWVYLVIMIAAAV